MKTVSQWATHRPGVGCYRQIPVSHCSPRSGVFHSRHRVSDRSHKNRRRRLARRAPPPPGFFFMQPINKWFTLGRVWVAVITDLLHHSRLGLERQPRSESHRHDNGLICYTIHPPPPPVLWLLSVCCVRLHAWLPACAPPPPPPLLSSPPRYIIFPEVVVT